MKNYYSLTLLVCLLAPICLSTVVFANVESLCKDIAKADPKNVRYDFCVSEIDFYSTVNKTAPQLGELSFTITMVKYDIIKLIMEEAEKLNQSMKMTLKDCLDVYSGVGADLLQGRTALMHGDFGAAKDKASAALKAAYTCGKRIKKTRDISKEIYEFMKINNDFQRMAAISLGFAKLLPRVN